MLGEFEYLLITIAAGLGDNAYGASIWEELAVATGRRCSLGALHTTVDRLEAKGLPETWMSDATLQRGGRAKRMIRMTPRTCGRQRTSTIQSAELSAARRGQ